MRTGWEIVIAGREFDPTAFLKTSQIQPCNHWERQIEDDGEQYTQRGIEFTDWHEGPYPLDMVTEAMDYLQTHRDEFQQLCSLRGVDERCLNFVDTLDGHGGGFEFEPSQIAILAELKFLLSICVLPSEECPTIECS